MTYPCPDQSCPDEFRGFNQARTTMWAYEARARVHERIDHTPFLLNKEVVAVHVNNVARADRIDLEAFDRAGDVVGGDTLYVDEPNQRLDVTPEFDHDFTRMPVPEGSALQQTIGRDNGWVINMEALRNHDLLDDRRATQRAVFLDHLADMVANGQVRGRMLDQTPDPDAADEPPGSAAA